MKKFNKIITIAVSADQIATQLASVISSEFKHRDALVEAIIGSAIHHEESMGFISNALNGWSNELEFAMGEKVICVEICRGKKDETMHPASTKIKRVEIGECEIVEVDPYRPSDKLKVAFYQDVVGGEEPELTQIWVDHSACSKIPASKISPYAKAGGSPTPDVGNKERASVIGLHDSARD